MGELGHGNTISNRGFDDAKRELLVLDFQSI